MAHPITRRSMLAGVAIAPLASAAPVLAAMKAGPDAIRLFIADLRNPDLDPTGAGDVTTGELWLREAIADDLERLFDLEPAEHEPFLRSHRDREWANRRAAAERRQALRSVR